MITTVLIIGAIVYGLSVLLIGIALLVAFTMLAGDPIPSRNWVWWFFIPTVLTWPLTPLWLKLIEWLDGRITRERKR